MASIDAVLAYNVLREKVGMDPLPIPPARLAMNPEQKRILQMRMFDKSQETLVIQILVKYVTTLFLNPDTSSN